jgi:hypothetical protein
MRAGEQVALDDVVLAGERGTGGEQHHTESHRQAQRSPVLSREEPRRASNSSATAINAAGISA